MVTTAIAPPLVPPFSLEEWLANPPDGTEWSNGQLLAKNGMTAKHGKLQARLASLWINYKNNKKIGGEVYTETPCYTINRGRCPDVAYLTPDLLAEHGDFNVLPQSFPLIAEIVSPTDKAEDIFAKANEYLSSGCAEIWLIFPESQWVIIITSNERFLFTIGEQAATQIILRGFKISIDELLA